ncbi:MAG TPA: hypothetical protein VFR08_05090 [Candidatus Angelobacter sp.]|nr:hypothetical protein [Candidatus Angelobacter sp.]
MNVVCSAGVTGVWDALNSDFQLQSAGWMNSLFWCDAEGMNKEVRDHFSRWNGFSPGGGTTFYGALIRLGIHQSDRQENKKKQPTEEEGNWLLLEISKGYGAP